MTPVPTPCPVTVWEEDNVAENIGPTIRNVILSQIRPCDVDAEGRTASSFPPISFLFDFGFSRWEDSKPHILFLTRRWTGPMTLAALCCIVDVSRSRYNVTWGQSGAVWILLTVLKALLEASLALDVERSSIYQRFLLARCLSGIHILFRGYIGERSGWFVLLLFCSAQQHVLSWMRRDETFYFIYRIRACSAVGFGSFKQAGYSLATEWFEVNVMAFLTSLMKDLVRVRWPKWWSRYVYIVKGGTEPIADF
jgi:hypothetical protein